MIDRQKGIDRVVTSLMRLGIDRHHLGKWTPDNWRAIEKIVGVERLKESVMNRFGLKSAERRITNAE